MSKIDNLIGKRYGKLTVIERDHENISKSGVKWVCVCDCGKSVSVFASNLKNGRTRSCGCLQSQLTSMRSKVHGDSSGERLFRIWKAMRSRCYYKKDVGYALYGGRGIAVCEEWRRSYISFKTWAMQSGYNDNLTIDRKDPDGNYEPENCRWITSKEQSNNTRRNVRITYKGITHTVAEWALITGLNAATIANRKRLGWSDRECIELPVLRGSNQTLRKKRKE